MELVVVIWLPPREILAAKIGEWLVIGCFPDFQGIINYFLDYYCFISRWISSSCTLLLQDGLVSNIFRQSIFNSSGGVFVAPL